MPPDLTKQEAAVYDRQLRVWGVEVQKRCAPACFACLVDCKLWLKSLVDSPTRALQVQRCADPALGVHQRHFCRGLSHTLLADQLCVLSLLRFLKDRRDVLSS